MLDVLILRFYGFVDLYSYHLSITYEDGWGCVVPFRRTLHVYKDEIK